MMSDPAPPSRKDSGAIATGAYTPSWWSESQSSGFGGSTSLRLAIFHWDDYPTARDVYLSEFPRRGHHVTWLLRGEADQDEIVESASSGVQVVECRRVHDSDTGFKTLKLLINRWRKWRAFWKKWHWIEQRAGRREYDLIQARDQLTEGLIAWSVARLHRIPFAFQLDYFHFEGDLYRRRRQGELSWMARWRRGTQIHIRDWLMRRADLVFPISATMRDECVRRGANPRRCVIFPVGVPESFLGAAIPREEARRNLGLDERPHLVYLGNLGAMRDADYILAVMAGVIDRHPETRLILVGAEPEELQSRLVQHGIHEHLAWAGRIDHVRVPEILSAADVGIFPLRMEDPYDLHRMSSPLKVVEYLSCGVPCVSSAIPEAAEVLHASGGGVVVEDEVDLFADAVCSLIRDGARARRMGASGREFVRRYKSTAVLAELVERAYLALLSGELEWRSR